MDPAAYNTLSASLNARKQGKAVAIELLGADLSDARLPRADLVSAKLVACRLDHANLAGAKFGKADLQQTQIRWAALNGTDFTATDLRGADMSWAQVEGACFADADMRGMSVNGATGEPATIAGARIDHEMCQRSHLDDFDIIQLWRAGAIIEDIEAFSAAVRHACGAAAEEEDEAPPSKMGAPARKLSQVGLEAHRQRQDHIRAPSEIDISVVTPNTPDVQSDGQIAIPIASPGSVRKPRMSMRSMRLVSEVLTPAMLQAPAWKQGDVVMGVTLEELIGKGSAAFVWRGSDEDGQSLAVKLFDRQCVDRGLSLPAYRRGVQVMNRLVAVQHLAHRIVRLHSVSLNQLGYVMEEAPNGSASDLPALNWSVESALTFFKQLCEGVQQAHDTGVLHRCIKPSNILLNDELEPLLTDFDMVDLPWLHKNTTDAGGYAVFAAPEELAGNGTQSPTADIYSLGCFLYFLLARERPKQPLTLLTNYEALAKYPLGLTRIVRKCTAITPSHRYQYISELSADLDNYLDEDTVGRAYDGDDEAAVSSLTQSRTWLGQARPGSDHPASSRAGRRSRPDGGGPTPSRAGRRSRPDGNQPRSSSAGRGRGHSDRPERRKAKSSQGSTVRKRDGDVNERKRTTERIVGTAGAMLLLVSLLAVEFSPFATKALIAILMQLVSAVAGGLLVFFIPTPAKNGLIWRLLMVLAGTLLLFLLDLPGLFAGI